MVEAIERSHWPSWRLKLLTVLNTAAATPKALAKRKRTLDTDWYRVAKRVKKGDTADPTDLLSNVQRGREATGLTELDVIVRDQEHDGAQQSKADESIDYFKIHFDADSEVLKDECSQNYGSSSEKLQLPGLGSCVLSASVRDRGIPKPVNERLSAKLEDYMSSRGSSTSRQHSLLKQLLTYRDILDTTVNLENREETRAAVAAHIVNHISRTRAKVRKTNEVLAQLADSGEPEFEVRDQGFTRPKALLLLPFRNSALAWVRIVASLSLANEQENLSRFESEFSLPEGTVDKLAEDSRDGKYPADHRSTFQGNIDDNFRVGIKWTGKSVKLYSDFYGSDLIFASPLGLRAIVDKDGHADFLSSVEILVIDQADVMLMQNWDHVQFVLEHLNKIPKEPHGCDFARVKPWYLDEKASLLRQTLVMSNFDAPELRALVSRSCKNVAGNLRTETQHVGVLSKVRPGLRQTFNRIELPDGDAVDSEDDARFQFFTTKILPDLLKSAVASTHTLIFVPSYFDYVRLKAHLHTLPDFDFAAISEYSTIAETTRARSHFANGTAAFLVITERLHFFRRYKIKGVKTIAFYAPPDHADYYAEILSMPFGSPDPEEGRPDESEVTCQIPFSRLDYLKLARIVGDADAERLCSDEGKSKFVFA